MTRTADLLGFIDSSGGLAGFLLPVFRHAGKSCIQEGDAKGRVNAFVAVDVFDGELILAHAVVAVRLGGPLLYAYRLPTGEILADEREQLRRSLAERHDILKSAPYARYEALLFVGAVDEARTALVAARNSSAGRNQRLADNWAESEEQTLRGLAITFSSSVPQRERVTRSSDEGAKDPSRRGTALWVVNHLRKAALSAFVKDLQALEDRGLSAKECGKVQDHLAALVSAAAHVPNGTYWQQGVYAPLERFQDAYVLWNSHPADRPAGRRHELERLRRRKRAMSSRIAAHQFDVMKVLDTRVALEMHEALSSISTDMPHLFPQLFTAAESFRNGLYRATPIDK